MKPSCHHCALRSQASESGDAAGNDARRQGHERVVEFGYACGRRRWRRRVGLASSRVDARPRTRDGTTRASSRSIGAMSWWSCENQPRNESSWRSTFESTTTDVDGIAIARCDEIRVEDVEVLGALGRHVFVGEHAERRARHGTCGAPRAPRRAARARTPGRPASSAASMQLASGAIAAGAPFQPGAPR